LSGGGKFEFGDRPEEFIGDLHQEAGTVTGAFVCAYGTTVFEVAQGGQGGVDNVVTGLTAERGDDGKATRVFFVFWVV
jgi:hypothetical protein